MLSYTHVHKYTLMILGLAVAAWTRPAVAGLPPYYLTLELVGASEHAPDHVCVVSPMAHPEWTKKKGGVMGPPDASLPLKDLESLARSEDRSSGSTQPNWRFDTASVTKLVTATSLTRPRIASALAALAFDPGTSGSCDTPGEVCRPSFDLPSRIGTSSNDSKSLHLACTPNERPTTRREQPTVAPSQKVLVLFLNTHTGVYPAIRRIKFDGNIVTIQFDGFVDDNDVFLASILGGHYLPGQTVSSSGRRIVLPVVPRCYIRNIELPYYDERSEQDVYAELTERHTSLLTCRASIVDGVVRMHLPARENSDLKQLELLGLSGLRLTANWSDRVPPEGLRTKLRGISLRWVRHCMYPSEESCPSASLLNSSVQCSDGILHGQECLYTCDAGAATVPLNIPEDVRFTRSVTNQSWTARVNFSGTRLDAYIEPLYRKIIITTPKASPEYSRWVDSIDIRLSKVRATTVPFSSGKNISIDAPGAECGDVVIYQYVGTRPFTSTTGTLRGGVLALTDTKDLATIIDGRMALGFGTEWAPSAELSQAGPTVSTGAVFDINPTGSVWFIGGTAELLYGQGGYLVQDSIGARTARSGVTVRALFGATAGLRSEWAATSFGIEGGFSISTPPDGRDPLPAQGVLASIIRTTYHITKRSSFSMIGRKYIFEHTRVFDEVGQIIASEAKRGFSFEMTWEWSLSSFINDLLNTRSHKRLLRHWD